MSADRLVSHPCITRYSGNPVLTGSQVPYPSDLVFNAGVIPWKNGYAMVFRNDYGYISRGSFAGTNIGLALSEDGLHWQVEEKPVFSLQDEETIRAYDPELYRRIHRHPLGFAASWKSPVGRKTLVFFYRLVRSFIHVE